MNEPTGNEKDGDEAPSETIEAPNEIVEASNEVVEAPSEVIEHAKRFDELATSYDETRNDVYSACAKLVVEHARPRSTDVVLDLGTGTGEIALALSSDAGEVIGRDISQGMLERARDKAESIGIENVSFDVGRFRDPRVEESVDVVVSNFAMHHLSDDEKRDAIEVIADLEPRRFVLGDVMLFEQVDEPYYDPDVDDPATVGTLAEALTERFDVTTVRRVHDQAGVIVSERPTSGEYR